MRIARRVLACLPLVALVSSCDSSQPTQVGNQTLSFNVRAVNAGTLTFDVWDYIEDNDGDSVADDGVTYLWCEQTASGLSALSVPWTFSVEMTVIRAGQTVAEAVTSTAARSDFANVAQYDTTTVLRGLTPLTPPRFAGQISGGVLTVSGRKFRFITGSNRRMPSVSLPVMTQSSSPLATVQGLTTLGQGVCSKGNPGTSRIDSVPLPYTFDVGPGDTIVFKAVIANEPAPGTALDQVVTAGLEPSGLSVSVDIEGRPLTPVGSTSGNTISFSYTAR